MIEYEYKEVVTKKFDKVPIRATCDICGKEILPEHDNAYNYFIITTHHYDWFNDSVDSFEYEACCSPECAKTHFTRYWDKNFNRGNTHKWEIERYDKLINIGY